MSRKSIIEVITMNILLAFLYVAIGAVVAFSIYYLHLKAGSRYYDESFNCVMIGIFWPVAAPFAFALYFAEEMNRRK